MHLSLTIADAPTDTYWKLIKLDNATFVIGAGVSTRYRCTIHPHSCYVLWALFSAIRIQKQRHSTNTLQKRLRRSLSEYHRSAPQTVTRGHIKHCLDTLRQTIMCSADDAPMPTFPRNSRSTGDGQAMECRSWDKLVEWSKSPEMETCFDSLDEYRKPKHNLERFAYCPKDSKYFPVMKAYFEKWGHKDVYWNRGRRWLNPEYVV